ncbi:DUF2290 domain-containing protein [Stenotrophomonas sp. TWI602]|uniref:DUF2290 domain-containing protein n=1 Tax=Stenotrophomonas sp. TWI602 TaxID=3136786 RepID=UPI003208BDE5
MDRRAVVEGINASWSFFDECALAESFASPDPLGVDEEFRRMVMSADCSHESLYSYCIQRSHFNILLYDHSFFQFSWSGLDAVRFAFYPNPHVSDLAGVNKFRKYRGKLSDGVIEDEDFSQLLRGMAYRGSIPIFRYENAPSQYVPLSHPCSHLHIGVHGDNRWALRRQLTPLAFSMLMAKHYYPEEWSMGVEQGSTSGENGFETRLRQVRSECRIIADFSAEEELAFHFF